MTTVADLIPSNQIESEKDQATKNGSKSKMDSVNNNERSGPSSVFDRLSNKSTFTGMYKARFTPGGKEDSIRDLSQITRAEMFKPSAAKKKGSGAPQQPKQGAAATSRTTAQESDGNRKPEPNRERSTSGANIGAHSNSSSDSGRERSGPSSVFDRLSNKSTFTGMYKARFTPGGKEDSIRDLSQITRAEMFKPSAKPQKKEGSSSSSSGGGSAVPASVLLAQLSSPTKASKIVFEKLQEERLKKIRSRKDIVSKVSCFDKQLLDSDADPQQQEREIESQHCGDSGEQKEKERHQPAEEKSDTSTA